LILCGDFVDGLNCKQEIKNSNSNFVENIIIKICGDFVDVGL
jgi:hypothetical protein